MSNHDRSDIRRDRRAKRDQLHFLHPLGSHVEHRHRAMRVDMRVAVTGKMLRRRDDVFALHTLDECGHVTADVFRILAEAARVDDRIVRIDIHVRDRREDLIHANRARLLRHHPPLPLGERGIAGCRQRHRRRPECRVGEAHPHPCLEVRAREQRNARLLLQPLVEQRGLVDVCLEPDDAADVIVANLMQQVAVRLRRLAHVHAVHAAREELSDFLVERHFRQRHRSAHGREE